MSACSQCSRVILKICSPLKIGVRLKTRGYHSCQIIGGASAGGDPYHQSPCTVATSQFLSDSPRQFPRNFSARKPLQSEWSPTTPPLPDEEQALYQDFLISVVCCLRFLRTELFGVSQNAQDYKSGRLKDMFHSSWGIYCLEKVWIITQIQGHRITPKAFK